MKKIYRFYKNRLVEISGRSRSLYSRKTGKKTSFDIGRLLDGDYAAIEEFTNFLFSGGKTYSLIDKNSKERICKNLKIDDAVTAQFKNMRPMKKDAALDESTRRARLKRDEETKAMQRLVADLKTLKREVEEFTQETGRCELFIGYPFVEGSIGRQMIVRAPLLLFPATIHIENENTAVLELKQNEPVQLNKVFAFAYAQHHKLDVESLVTEFDSMAGAKLKNIDAVINYLRGFGFRLGHPPRKGMFNFLKAKEPHLGDPIDVKHYALIGRYPLANAIYNDYEQLQRRKSTEAIGELLENKRARLIKKPDTDLFTISALDYSQEEAIGQLNKSGNMVIYGPPGTGKSQTIVNIITDALCKNKRVLVVSQKKAALDVVYNRLGNLAERAMYINDPEKGKTEFYTRTKNAHLAIMNGDTGSNQESATKFKQINQALADEQETLQSISDCLFKSTNFGPTLQEMYVKSVGFGQSVLERHIYEELMQNVKLRGIKYNELSDATRIILERRKHDFYWKLAQIREGNPLVTHIRSDLDVNTINAAKGFVDKVLQKQRITPFDMSRYPGARYLLAFYLESGLTEDSDLGPIIRAVSKMERRPRAEVAQNLRAAAAGIKNYIGDYSIFRKTLDAQGFAMTIEGIINGNPAFIRMLKYALDNYVFVRGLNINMQQLSPLEVAILDFCHAYTRTEREFKEAVEKIVAARVYHEVVESEERYKHTLAKTIDFDAIRNRILSLKSEKQQVVRDISQDLFKLGYKNLYNSSNEFKNFFYQINKDKNLWAIRHLIEVYQELMLSLFPCWLLSPESVSTILPLTEGLFDLVLFDEASQVFIENTLPTIYRSRHIVVAGDNKQLRPTALFMKRYMGSDLDERDLNMQAALEVESLLDLATSRYASVNLNYHYRSQHEELITFSNYAFYDRKLQIAPNITKNNRSKPIQRIKVAGQWLDRKNKIEAAEVLKLLKTILKTRKNKETIGIITFNAEQESYIEDLIDKESARDEKFREAITREKSRKENGEHVGLFIKNLENVQGDERDIIIFSIGYAKNEHGKVVSHFGPLNMEGGENRLNVAITRAKKKIYIITSIEPEDLNVEGTKNAGPKLFKKYLQYVRAVSGGNRSEVATILDEFKPSGEQQAREVSAVVMQVKSALEKLGHTVEVNLGSNNYKLSLAIYDKAQDKFIVGVEFDDAAFHSSKSVMERDVFRGAFMESRGWKILRVWSRDFWLNPTRVINRIDKAAKRIKSTQ